MVDVDAVDLLRATSFREFLLRVHAREGTTEIPCESCAAFGGAVMQMVRCAGERLRTACEEVRIGRYGGGQEEGEHWEMRVQTHAVDEWGLGSMAMSLCTGRVRSVVRS